MKKALCALFWLLAVTAAMAQVGVDGTILGVVTDANGGVIAGATVTVLNIDTGIKKSETSHSDGSFEITALSAGRYSISATFTGFKTWTVERAEFSIAERKRVSPILEVGQVSEKVTVESTADLIQTENAVAGGTIQAATIQELPLNGRDVVQVSQFVPGVRYGGRDLHKLLRGRKQLQRPGIRTPRRPERVQG